MFRPCIDLHDGKVKQIVGGSLTDSSNKLIENFISDLSPVYYAELFKKHQLKGGHVIMLGKGNETVAVEALNAYRDGLQIGGGITLSNGRYYLEQGASHVIVTSYIFEEGQLNIGRVKEMVQEFGKERLVLDLSCRKRNGEYYVVTNRWQTFTDFIVNRENIQLLEEYCDELLIHGVDVEGLKQGIDLALVELLAKNTEIPVTYAGGIRSIADIELIRSTSKGRMHYTIGSALDIFGGSLSFEEVVRKGI